MKKKLCVLCTALVLLAAHARAATLNTVAAVVNGQMISMYDLRENARPELLRNRLNPDSAPQKTAVDALLRKVLDGMILDILIAQEAERVKVAVAPAEVEEEIARVMQQSRLSKADFEKQLQREGLTVDSLRVRVSKTILRQKLMGLMVGRKVVVTPEEVAAYYEAHKDEMRSNRTLRMALLVYPPNVDADAFARKIKNGASFEDVARQVSVGPNKNGGGDVGPVMADKLNPEWRARLSKLSAGQTSDIFVLEGRKAQVKLLRAPEGGDPMDLKTATSVIENILREPRLQERFVEYTDALRKKAVIDIRMQAS